MYNMILLCKENIKHTKVFGKDIQIVNTTLSLDGGMVGHLDFFFYCSCKCSNFPPDVHVFPLN